MMPDDILLFLIFLAFVYPAECLQTDALLGNTVGHLSDILSYDHTFVGRLSSLQCNQQRNVANVLSQREA